MRARARRASSRSRPGARSRRGGRRGSEEQAPLSSRGRWRPACPLRTWSGAGVSAGWLGPVEPARLAGRGASSARVYMASAPVTSTTSSSPRPMARQASCIKACGVLPPTAESIELAPARRPAAKPRRAATWSAGLTECQPSGTTTRRLSARASREFPAGAAPPAGTPSQSSAAARRALAMSSTGSGRSAGASPASAGVTTWPTPTTTGVRGSRAMDRGAYRVTPRGLPGLSVDSMLMRVAVGSDHAGFDLKEILRGELAAQGHDVADLGTHDGDDLGRLPRLRRGGRPGGGRRAAPTSACASAGPASASPWRPTRCPASAPPWCTT